MNTKKNQTVNNSTAVKKKSQSKKLPMDVCEEMQAQIRRDFGNRLTDLREKHQLTQAEMLRHFVESSPMTTSGYSRWENGMTTPDIAFLKQLHEKWKVDLNWLIAGDESFVPELPVEVQNAISVLENYKRECVFRK